MVEIEVKIVVILKKFSKNKRQLLLFNFLHHFLKPNSRKSRRLYTYLKNLCSLLNMKQTDNL